MGEEAEYLYYQSIDGMVDDYLHEKEPKKKTKLPYVGMLQRKIHNQKQIISGLENKIKKLEMEISLTKGGK